MAKKVEYTVYTYAELLELHKQGEVSADAVERAAQWLRECQTDHEWWEFVYSDWKTALEQIGFTDADISFSGFWSQGDGASFTSGIDIERMIAFLSTPIGGKPQILDDEPGGWLPYVVHKLGGKVTNERYGYLGWIVNYLSGTVERLSHHYSHENTCRARIDLDSYRERPEIEELVNRFEEDVEGLRKDLCRIIYRALEDEYDGLTSDESIADCAEANEYTFTINGRREG